MTAWFRWDCRMGYELKENKRVQIKPGFCIGKLTVIEETSERNCDRGDLGT